MRTQDPEPKDPEPQDPTPALRNQDPGTRDPGPNTSRYTTQDNANSCAWFLGKVFFTLVDIDMYD